MTGESTSTPNATTNGNAGLNAAREDVVGRQVLEQQLLADTEQQAAAYASGMLPRPPSTAAAIAAITSASYAVSPPDPRTPA